MTPDFSNLGALSVDETKTAEYVFELPDGTVIGSVWSAPALDSNKPFLNERLRISLEKAEAAEAAPKQARSRGLTPKDIDDARETDRTLLARTCAKRWGIAPRDVKGNAPEFDEANCYAFFCALPDWLFDPYRGWASNPANFYDRKAATNASALGNDLPPA